MRNEKAMITGTAQSSKPQKPQLERADIVIIGNGIAGLTAAIEARRLAPDKHIVIITDQIHPTINTPALKQFAIGKLDREQLLAYPPGIERAERIHLVNAHVEEIHAGSKYLKTSDGYGFGYDKLLIATGSTPTGLPAQLPGRNFDGVCTLHRLQDYLDLRRRLSEVSEAAVIGGGAHAIETVMGLLHWNIRVHWLIRGSTFMNRILDQTASEMVLERVQKAGGKVYTNTEVMGIVGRVGATVGVITNQKEMIPCQLVLTCTGTKPVMTLAEHCTLPMRHKNGIFVDEQLRTSVSDVYAAGDVAALLNPQTGEYEPRALWYAAVAQGRAVAAAMTGHDELERQSFGVQWHATHLGDLSMLTVGSPLSTGPNILTLTDTSQGSYRRLAIVDDRLVGYLALGAAQPDSLAIKRIIDEGHSVRDITKALLKGNFDARQYDSKQHSRKAVGMLTGQLIAPAAILSSSQKLPGVQQPSTGQLPAPVAPPQRDTDEMLPALPHTDELVAPALRPTQPVYEMAFQTQPQPSISPYQQRRQAQQIAPLVVEEELSPFTGTLPTLADKITEATLPPMQPDTPEPRRTPSRSLWSYSAKQPAVQPNSIPGKKDPSQLQQPAEVHPSHHSPHPTHNLWSYSKTPNTTTLERER